MRNSYVVGHVPLGLSKPFSNLHCLDLPYYALSLEKNKSWAGLGLEISVMNEAREHKKALQWLEKPISKIRRLQNWR